MSLLPMVATPFLALVLVQATYATPPLQLTETRRVLDTQVEHYTISADSLLHSLAQFSAQFRIPMGIEWVRSPNTLRGAKLSWDHTTPNHILTSLLAQYPGYEFQIAGDIVHVFPRDFFNDRGNVLNVRIDSFEAKHEFVSWASRRLAALARRTMVVSFPTPPSSSGGGEGLSIGSGMGDRPVSLELQGITVRDVLDELSLASNLKIWIVTYPEFQMNTPRGFRRTISPYREGGVPDESQPIWVFLPWGIRPPDFPK